MAEIPAPQPTEKGETDTPSAVATQTAAEPKMGDTRMIDGQKQIYFLGFGWIEDCDEPNECIYAEDMYQNGNMVGSMGGGIIGESDGDINKMVGRMD